jgi:deoxyribodipyrimidine photo-lyase
VIQVVWFKRDLRVEDHQPLVKASACGPVIALYVFEPEMMMAADYSAQHFGFIQESLSCLEKKLHDLDLALVIKHAPILEVLSDLQCELKEFTLLSHEETGNALSFKRDVSVARWCQANRVTWQEFESNGVVRRLQDRNLWTKHWNKRLSSAPLPAPKGAKPYLREKSVHEWPHQPKSQAYVDLLSRGEDKENRQLGGLAEAQECLTTFLQGRGANYRRAMSSPLLAQDACSRLSPYLAFGVLSVRQVVHALARAQDHWKGVGQTLAPPGLISSLASFESRLHWHCHFIQKLESEPRIEFDNLHSAYNGMRDSAPNGTRLKAWAQGETGYPMIDACMRMLLSTGWINFRMRAMLTSFSSYQLWQHWREPALHLARQFLDYEPGIHYPQIQMQSGTTGINTIRIYNPVKQAMDHDPQGVFVRRWLPELTRLPDAFLFEPWKTPLLIQQEAGCIIGKHYPHPIIDLSSATKFAREKVWGVRKEDRFTDQAQAIFEKHGSRLANREARPQSTRRTAAKKPMTTQQDLF